MIGKTLKEIRVSKDLSISDVSSAIRINKKYIQALEDENFLLLPSLVHAKGFLKAYATYLGLDPKQLISELAEYFAAIEAQKVKKPVQNEKKINYSQYLILSASLLVVIVFIMLAFISGSFINSNAGKENVVKKPEVIVEKPTIKTKIAGKTVEIKLEISKNSHLEVWVEDKKMFEKDMEPGDIKTFIGAFIRVKTSDGTAVKVSRDGILYGPMGTESVGVEHSYKATL